MSTTLVVVGFEMFITDALRTGVVVGRKNFEKLGHYEKPNEKKSIFMCLADSYVFGLALVSLSSRSNCSRAKVRALALLSLKYVLLSVSVAQLCSRS